MHWYNQLNDSDLEKNLQDSFVAELIGAYPPLGVFIIKLCEIFGSVCGARARVVEYPNNMTMSSNVTEVINNYERFICLPVNCVFVCVIGYVHSCIHGRIGTGCYNARTNNNFLVSTFACQIETNEQHVPVQPFRAAPPRRKNDLNRLPDDASLFNIRYGPRCINQTKLYNIKNNVNETASLPSRKAPEPNRSFTCVIYFRPTPDVPFGKSSFFTLRDRITFVLRYCALLRLLVYSRLVSNSSETHPDGFSLGKYRCNNPEYWIFRGKTIRIGMEL